MLIMRNQRQFESVTISSFTERAYLSHLFLNYLMPSPYQETRIEVREGESALDRLRDLKVTPLKKRSLLHHPLLVTVRFIARVAFLRWVIPVVAGTGVLVNGSLALYHFCRFRFGEEGSEEEALAKTQGYKQAAKTDAYVLICTWFFNRFVELGGSFLKSASLGFISCRHFSDALIAARAVISLCLGGTIFFIGGFIVYKLPISLIPSFVADMSRRTSMREALKFRDCLGVVDQKGNLLPIAPDAHRRRAFLYNKLIIEGELEYNDLLKKINPKLPVFTSVEQADQTILTLQRELNTGKLTQAQLQSQITLLSATVHKITVLRLWDLDSMQVTFMNMPMQPDAYSTCTHNWRTSIEGKLIDLPYDPIDPKTGPKRPENSGYAQFKYDVLVAKGRQNRQKINLYKLIGLNEHFSKKELDAASKRYSLFLHPDKNGGKEEAVKLFQLLKEIVNELELQIS